MNSLFNICVKFLQWLGATFSLSYVEISVIFNLWVQGTVLLLSALLPLVGYLRRAESVSLTTLAALVGYFTVYLAGYVWMLWRYRLPFDSALDVCAKDLQWLGTVTLLGYNAVNIIIFVLIFLALIALNMILAHRL